MKTIQMIGVMIFLMMSACGGGGNRKSYQDIISTGWGSFSDGDYRAAFDRFSDAVNKNPEQAAGYAGLGWTLMLMDDIVEASTTFSLGSTKINPPADLYAGWGLVLNAQKNYALANNKIAQAVGMDPDWSLFGGDVLDLDVNDLHVCMAENFFMLGQFTQSLAEVKILNAGFALTSISTDDDKATLALEIQRLKGLSKRI